MTLVYDYLLENGPSELQSKSIPLSHGFRDEISRFDIPGSPVACGTNAGISRRSVYYIEDEHSQEEVLREFNRVNNGTLEDLPGRSLLQRVPSEFRQTAKEVFDVSYGTGGDHGGYGGVCPCCGGEYEGELPRHLRKECEKK